MKVGDTVVINSKAVGTAKNFIGRFGTITSLSGSSAALVKVDAHPEELFCLHSEIDKTVKKVPHKHAEVIKAWADGAKIEMRTQQGKWMEINDPTWCAGVEYRVKQEPKPDIRVICKLMAYPDQIQKFPVFCNPDGWVSDVTATFDGETGKLKGVEFIGPP